MSSPSAYSFTYDTGKIVGSAYPMGENPYVTHRSSIARNCHRHISRIGCLSRCSPPALLSRMHKHRSLDQPQGKYGPWDPSYLGHKAILRGARAIWTTDVDNPWPQGNRQTLVGWPRCHSLVVFTRGSLWLPPFSSTWASKQPNRSKVAEAVSGPCDAMCD